MSINGNNPLDRMPLNPTELREGLLVGALNHILSQGIKGTLVQDPDGSIRFEKDETKDAQIQSIATSTLEALSSSPAALPNFSARPLSPMEHPVPKKASFACDGDECDPSELSDLIKTEPNASADIPSKIAASTFARNRVSPSSDSSTPSAPPLSPRSSAELTRFFPKKEEESHPAAATSETGVASMAAATPADTAKADACLLKCWPRIRSSLRAAGASWRCLPSEQATVTEIRAYLNDSKRTHLSNVKSIHLGSLQIDQLPQELRFFPHLTELILNNNNFRSFPDVSFLSSSLKRLHLENNKIESLATLSDTLTIDIALANNPVAFLLSSHLLTTVYVPVGLGLWSSQVSCLNLDAIRELKAYTPYSQLGDFYHKLLFTAMSQNEIQSSIKKLAPHLQDSIYGFVTRAAQDRLDRRALKFSSNDNPYYLTKLKSLVEWGLRYLEREGYNDKHCLFREGLQKTLTACANIESLVIPKELFRARLKDLSRSLSYVEPTSVNLAILADARASRLEIIPLVEDSALAVRKALFEASKHRFEFIDHMEVRCDVGQGNSICVVGEGTVNSEGSSSLQSLSNKGNKPGIELHNAGCESWAIKLIPVTAVKFHICKVDKDGNILSKDPTEYTTIPEGTIVPDFSSEFKQ